MPAAVAAVPDGETRRYQPYGAARDLWLCREREVLLAGPAGTGKSRACLEKLHAAAAQSPRFRGAIVRKVRRSLTQAALVTFEEKVLPRPSGVHFHHEDQEYRYPNGARIIVGGLDDAEKIKSTEFDLIYVQEATELVAEDWGILLTRLRNGAITYQQLMADCNPAAPDHWLKQRCDVGACTLLESRHEDNPSLSADYLATLDSLTGYQYQRLRLGLWVAAEGMYFAEWDPAVHTCAPFAIPESWPRWRAVDWGYASPFCCLWAARSPGGRVYIYRELYGAGILDEDQALRIRLLSAGEAIRRSWGDPSMWAAKRNGRAVQSFASIYEQGGVHLEPGNNDRAAGWQVLRRMLATSDAMLPTLQVFRPSADRRGGCPHLIRTLPTLVFDQADPEDLDTDGEDHAADALRYLLMGLYGQADKRPGDQTYSLSGSDKPSPKHGPAGALAELQARRARR